MVKNNLSMNMDFECNGNKGRIVQIEEDFFTILWIETKQFYDYPYDEELLKSIIPIKQIEIDVGKKEKVDFGD